MPGSRLDIVVELECNSLEELKVLTSDELGFNHDYRGTGAV